MFIVSALCLVALGAVPASAVYPDHPVRIIVPYAPAARRT